MKELRIRTPSPILGQVMFICLPSALGAVELVAGFGMAYFRPSLKVIRGGDAAEGSDILQTANRNLTRTECARPQNNVDASVKYVRPPAMKHVPYSFNSIGGQAHPLLASPLDSIVKSCQSV